MFEKIFGSNLEFQKNCRIIPFMTIRFVYLWLLIVPSLVFAQSSLEQRAQSLDKRLIAPCCWTSTLDQHFSQEAEEMKAEIRSRLAGGQSEQAILDHFEKKFGERILSQPKASGFNLTVWIFPGIAIILGFALLLRILKSKQAQVEEITNTLTLSTSSSESDDKYRKMIDEELYRT